MFVNGFINDSGISSKSGAIFDSRQCWTQSRQNATTYGERLFDNLNNWVTSASGVSIVPSSSPDPAIGNVVFFQSGGVLNTPAFIQQKFTTIPNNFGFSIFTSLIDVGTNISDALFVQIQKTTNNKNIQLKFTMLGVFLFINGQWAQISTHGNESWCEWWFEVSENNGIDTISTYAGTQQLSTISGYLPTGPFNNNGLVYIGQESGNLTNRKSQVAYFAIGITQLFDNFSITTTEYVVPVAATAISCVLLVEDVSASMCIGDIAVEVSIDSGAFSAIPLVDKGELCKGVIDSAKSIKIFTGTLSKICNKNSKLTARIKLLNHKFSGLHGFNIIPTSTM